MSVSTEIDGPIFTVSINRPDRRNAVDHATADALVEAFLQFEDSAALSVAILTGGGGQFCAGADLKAIAEGQTNRVELDGDGPMGPTRMMLSKPVIAAVEGYAVAGGLELALWCDMRVAARGSVFGVYCRRFGVPLIDGGTIRLPRLIGMSRAMDMILTGRPVEAEEALQFGLANRVCAQGEALTTAKELARQIAAFPQTCLRNDRLSAYRGLTLEEADALVEETRRGMETLMSGETSDGAARFTGGEGRGGSF